MAKILFSLAIVFSGLITGYIFQHLRFLSYGSLNNSRVRKILQKSVIIFLNPIAFIGSIWILNLKNFHLMFIPLAGIIALSSGAVIALIMARFLKMNRKETGAFFCCGSFTNIGNVGALVCYSFLGENGFAYVPFYKLFEELMYFAIGFPIAKRFGSAEEKKKRVGKRAITVDPLVFTVLLSITTGFILNLSGAARPEIFKAFNAIIIPFSSFLMMVTIGMAMRFGKMKDYILKAVTILPVKHFIVPVITSAFAFQTGLGDIDSALPLKVVLILSSMPVAVTSLIPPALYDLDLDLANTCWFISTLFMIVTIPTLNALISFF